MDQVELMEILLNMKQYGFSKEKIFPELHDQQKVVDILSNPLLQTYISDINNLAVQYREKKITSLPFSLYKLYYTVGDRLKFETEYFDRRGRLMTFALLFWLYKKEEDLIQLEDILWAICDEYSWILPAHGRNTIDLFAAETAFALAEIIYMLEKSLSKMVVQRVKKEIFHRIIDPYIQYPKMYNWELMKNNWCAVCAGSIGVVSIYLIEDEEILAKIISRILPTLERFIDSFEEDGTCLEGLSYWTYGVSFYVSFADLLKRRTGGRVDLLEDKKFKEIAEFQQKCYLSEGCTVSFSDGFQYDNFRMGITSYLVQKFEQVQMPPYSSASTYIGDQIYRWCMGLRDLLWTNLNSTNSILNATNEILPYAQWIICRDHTRDRIGFAAKGGHNNEPHNHNDIGSFIYAKNGKALLVDLGCGEYVQDYFNENRYSIFCNHSFSHSVPIIDDEGQCAGAKYRAYDVKYIGNTILSMNIAKAYENSNLQKLIRRFEFLGQEGVRLTDYYSFVSCPKSVVERFVTIYQPVIQNNRVKISTKGEKVIIYFDPDQMLPFIMQHHHKDHNGYEVLVYSIDFRIKNYFKEFECNFYIR